MRKFILAIWLMLWLGSVFFVNAQPGGNNSKFLTDNLLFTAMTDTSEFVSINESDSMAFGVATISVNSTQDTICFNATISGVTDSITAVGIYQGTLGNFGVEVFDLLPYTTNNERIVTTITAPFLSASTIAGLLNGNYSFYVFTIGNTNATVGAPFRLERDHSFMAAMNGDQEVPSSGSTAYGLSIFEVSMDHSTMKLNMIVQDLSGPITGAHIHFGKPGVAGPVIVDLTDNVNGNQIDATLDSGVFMMALDSMMMGDAYINVHTAIYPNGELRGQIKMDSGLAFHSMLTGEQEVPGVNTNAIGLAHVVFDAVTGAMDFHVITDGLSDSVTNATINFGASGVNGDSLFAISDSSDNFLLMGTIDSTITSDSLLKNFLEGNVYVNLFTDAHPNGEIRGQLERYNWEGFTYSMNGQEEIPAVVTQALGSGFASISPEQNDLHFGFAAVNLSGPVSGAHFHHGGIGESGPVIFSLVSSIQSVTDSTTGQVSVFGKGHWNDAGGTSLTADDVQHFSNDSVYINIHTDFAPNGEIRGQVLHGTECFSLVTGIGTVASVGLNSLGIFPNPATDQAVITVESNESEKTIVQLYDISGKIYLQQDITLVRGTNQQVIDLHSLKPGLYFVAVRSGNDFLVQKLEKQ